MCSRAFASIRRACRRLIASGFSQSTCLPACKSLQVIGFVRYRRRAYDRGIELDVRSNAAIEG